MSFWVIPSAASITRKRTGWWPPRLPGAHKAGLMTIVCVGETTVEREEGLEKSIVESQLADALPFGTNVSKTVIAYEPVWAIGTGKTATPDDVAAMHLFIRSKLKEKLADSAQMRILYGGSVKPENAAELFSVPNVDGALIGGASLKAEDYLAIAPPLPFRAGGLRAGPQDKDHWGKMASVILVIHLFLALAIIGLVLLQRSEGGGLGIGGSGGLGGLATPQNTANILTRTTAICAAGFFTTSLILGAIAGHRDTGTSNIMNSLAQPGQVAPAPCGAAHPKR